MYKVIVDALAPVATSNYPNRLELWDCQSHLIKTRSPRWVWEIGNGAPSANKPIIAPCNGDWNLRLTLNNENKSEAKVKYMWSRDNQAFHSPFLFVPAITSELLQG